MGKIDRKRQFPRKKGWNSGLLGKDNRKALSEVLVFCTTSAVANMS